MVGRPVMEVAIFEVMPDSVAEAAGLLSDDLIYAVNGEPVEGSIDNIVNIVQASPEQSVELSNLGVGIILNSSTDDFIEDLKRVISEENPQIILDAISGDFPGTLLKNATNDTVLVNYANLSQSDLILPTMPITRFGKKVEGFHLAYWSYLAQILR